MALWARFQNWSGKMRAGERGTSLVEAIISTTVGIIAALAMVFALASGNAGIRGMRVERAAFFAVQQQIETLLAKPTSDPALSVGSHGPQTVTLPYGTGQTTWSVSWVDDALDGTGGGDTNTQDYKKLQVTVTWTDVVSRSVALSTYIYP